MRIHKLKFLDLYIGQDFSEFTNLEGVPGLSKVPAPLEGDVDFLRQQCLEKYNRFSAEDFSLDVKGTMFRVTVIEDLTETVTFALRRSSAEIRSALTLPFPEDFLRFLLGPEIRGIVLVAGEVATGKTSTVSSLFKHRLEVYGGIANAIEDPPETPLHGVHGKGRAIHVWARESEGGYQAHLKRGLRTGASMFLVGEVRDEATAAEVARAGINGHPTFTTIHAQSVVTAIQRLHTLCSGATAGQAGDLLALGLAAVIWQTIVREGEGDRQVSFLRAKVLRVQGIPSVMSKIRRCEWSQLEQEVADQANKHAFKQFAG